MASEPNLRDMFRADDQPNGEGNRIDTAAVIRRAKLRRLPAQIGVGGVFALAIGGLGVAGLQGLNSAQPSSLAVGSAASDAPGSDSPRPEKAPSSDDSVTGASEGPGVKRAPADRINLCGGELAEVAPSSTGLTLTVDFPDVAAGAPSVAGTVTLTNTGSQPVTGYTSARMMRRRRSAPICPPFRPARTRCRTAQVASLVSSLESPH
jgi:hypothetical protein